MFLVFHVNEAANDGELVELQDEGVQMCVHLDGELVQVGGAQPKAATRVLLRVDVPQGHGGGKSCLQPCVM